MHDCELTTAAVASRSCSYHTTRKHSGRRRKTRQFTRVENVLVTVDDELCAPVLTAQEVPSSRTYSTGSLTLYSTAIVIWSHLLSIALLRYSKRNAGTCDVAINTIEYKRRGEVARTLSRALNLGRFVTQADTRNVTLKSYCAIS